MSERQLLVGGTRASWGYTPSDRQQIRDGSPLGTLERRLNERLAQGWEIEHVVAMSDDTALFVLAKPTVARSEVKK